MKRVVVVSLYIDSTRLTRFFILFSVGDNLTLLPKVAEPQQARCLSALVRQEEIAFELFGDAFEYAYSKRLPHPIDKRAELEAIVREAIEYYGSVPVGKRNFDVAKTEYQRVHPL